jgi:hypothetical protein
MRSHKELVDLARVSLNWARMLTTPSLVTAFENVAKEYQRRAAELDAGKLPDIGEHK